MKKSVFILFFAAVLPVAGFSEISSGNADEAAGFLSSGDIRGAVGALKGDVEFFVQNGCLSAALRQIKGENEEFDSSCLAARQKGLLLLLALELKDIEAARQYIAAGADLNTSDKYGGTALHLAVWKGQKEAAALLLANGANPNIKERALGRTALHYAVQVERKELAALLLANGADPNIRDSWSGAAALHYAARSGQKELAALLLANGADPNIQSKPSNRTALHDAASKGRTDIVELLLAGGADTEIETKAELTAFDLAMTLENKDTARLLAERTESFFKRNWRLYEAGG